MIDEPFNDGDCLGPISQYLRELVAERDPVLVKLAERYQTDREVIDYIRALPQRDDLGDPQDGPRVHACTPSQRLRIAPRNPNCVERATVLVALMELLNPNRRYQLATVDTPVGAHTFPLVNRRPVVLDPRVTEECLECGIAINQPGPVAIEPRKAVAWMIDMASQQAGSVRNGPSAFPIGRRAIHRLIDEGAIPSQREIESMGILFALAEYAAERYGTRAVGIARTAARAISDVLDVVLSRRNAHLDIGGLKFDTPSWLDQSADAVGHFGLDLGGAVARQKLDALDVAGMLGLPGGTASLIGLLESELNKQGRTLGTISHPPSLPTFAKYAEARTG